MVLLTKNLLLTFKCRIPLCALIYTLAMTDLLSRKRAAAKVLGEAEKDKINGIVCLFELSKAPGVLKFPIKLSPPTENLS